MFAEDFEDHVGVGVAGDGGPYFADYLVGFVGGAVASFDGVAPVAGDEVGVWCGALVCFSGDAGDAGFAPVVGDFGEDDEVGCGVGKALECVGVDDGGAGDVAGLCVGDGGFVDVGCEDVGAAFGEGFGEGAGGASDF